MKTCVLKPETVWNESSRKCLAEKNSRFIATYFHGNFKIEWERQTCTICQISCTSWKCCSIYRAFDTFRFPDFGLVFSIITFSTCWFKSSWGIASFGTFLWKENKKLCDLCVSNLSSKTTKNIWSRYYWHITLEYLKIYY